MVGIGMLVCWAKSAEENSRIMNAGTNRMAMKKGVIIRFSRLRTPGRAEKMSVACRTTSLQTGNADEGDS
jgi:hypothetical protein